MQTVEDIVVFLWKVNAVLAVLVLCAGFWYGVIQLIKEML